MSILKCKMCGGDLHVEEGMTVCECEYCLTKQTVPSIDDDKKQKLYDRANKLRFNCDFDKAAGVYESIVNEFPDDAESYWGLILCKYGIEYVDDPATGRKIPTCHRSSFDSVMDDPDFEMVMENADSDALIIYRQEAKQIEELRRSILEVSGKEEPYDIFICYKETDDTGSRTLDSVLAQDVYDALTDKGYRVFFSRISLEDKLGTEYEPYIFAALNSARVMLAFGTSYQNYNAVWVKNEWSRFLKLMAADKEKYLIPCFKDIDAYDIPKEFVKFQAQDLGKVGAIQDLMRGIDKIFGNDNGAKKVDDTPQTFVQQVQVGGPNVEALLKRGYDSLEDGAFDEAKSFFSDALNSNAESAEAYLGLFMAEIKCNDKDSVRKEYIEGNYKENRYWKRARQYATGDFAVELTGWDNGRNARLKREADEREARLSREADEREARLKREEKENVRTDYVKTGIAGFMNRLNEDAVEIVKDIKTKKHQLLDLGLFKGKEKKKLQSEIEELQKKLKTKIRETKVQYAPMLKDVVNKIKEGDTIPFGQYYKTHDRDMGELEWKVLKKVEGRVLLLSRYGISTQAYNLERKPITWEQCTLRSLLNDHFVSIAFNEVEREFLVETQCPADKNPSYSTEVGNSTTDKVFLLSIAEVNEYFRSDADRQCQGTEYFYSRGGEKQSNGNCWWRLRSPGCDTHFAACVNQDGVVMSDKVGNYVDCTLVAVRPAMWIDFGVESSNM